MAEHTHVLPGDAVELGRDSAHDPRLLAHHWGLPILEVEDPEPMPPGSLLRFRGRWVIAVDATLPLHQKLLTIAHELGHYYLHRTAGTAWYFSSPHDTEEYEAGLFARYFLGTADLGRNDP